MEFVRSRSTKLVLLVPTYRPVPVMRVGMHKKFLAHDALLLLVHYQPTRLYMLTLLDEPALKTISPTSARTIKRTTLHQHHTAGCGKQIATLSIWLGSWLLAAQGRICHLVGMTTHKGTSKRAKQQETSGLKTDDMSVGVSTWGSSSRNTIIA